MTTTVTKSIGSGGGRDYSTISAWIAACPANLVTSDQVWRGEMYADSEFVGANSISGITTDSTRYIELTAAAGESFADDSANPLRYDTASGVALRSATAYVYALSVNVAHTRVSRLQVKATAGSGGLTLNSVSSARATDFIVESHDIAVRLYGSTQWMANVLAISRASNKVVANILDGAKAYNCTFVNVRSGGTSAAGVGGIYSAATLKNCYIGGAASATSGTTPTKTTCYTDLSGPPSGFSGTVALSTATFGNVTDGTHDFRLVSGSGLIDVGTTESTYAATDIFGVSRPIGSAYDVGASEFESSGGLNITASLGTASATGYAATVDRQRAIAASLGTATAQGYGATVNRSRDIAASLGTATASGYGATVNRQRNIAASLGAATAQGYDATISFGSDLTIAASLGFASADGYQANVNLRRDIAASLGTATALGYQASISDTDPLHGFTQDQLDFLVAYMEANMAIPTAAEIATAIYANTIDGKTLTQHIRLLSAVLGGKVSGAGTGTETFRDIADTKDRIVATVDSSGNRTAITLDLD